MGATSGPVLLDRQRLATLICGLCGTAQLDVGGTVVEGGLPRWWSNRRGRAGQGHGSDRGAGAGAVETWMARRGGHDQVARRNGSGSRGTADLGEPLIRLRSRGSFGGGVLAIGWGGLVLG
jgi:hypothetical protein